jgi:hypothetical protein
MSSVAISTTEFTVTSTGQDFSIPGDWTPAQIVNMYGTTIPGLGNMDSTAEVDGSTRKITFRPKTGTKGARLFKTGVKGASLFKRVVNFLIG